MRNRYIIGVKKLKCSISRPNTQPGGDNFAAKAALLSTVLGNFTHIKNLPRRKRVSAPLYGHYFAFFLSKSDNASPPLKGSTHAFICVSTGFTDQ